MDARCDSTGREMLSDLDTVRIHERTAVFVPQHSTDVHSTAASGLCQDHRGLHALVTQRENMSERDRGGRGLGVSGRAGGLNSDSRLLPRADKASSTDGEGGEDRVRGGLHRGARGVGIVNGKNDIVYAGSRGRRGRPVTRTTARRALEHN